MCSLFVCLLPSHPRTRETSYPIACGKGILLYGGWVVGGVVLGKRIPEFSSRGLLVINRIDRFLSTSQPSLSFKIKGATTEINERSVDRKIRLHFRLVFPPYRFVTNTYFTESSSDWINFLFFFLRNRPFHTAAFLSLEI